MASFQQKLGNVKESLTSLFKNRRRRSLLPIDAYTSSGGISTPQNVKRVMHITFDAGRKSFDGIPADWRPFFTAATAVDSAECATPTADDDSGVSMATGGSAAPKELLSLTYDRDRGRFVDLPPHWQDRLQRNNLLEPEFQKNPDLLVTVFALMDEELRTMQREGFDLEKDLYSSSPTTEDRPADCAFFYEIEADHSNSSSEQSLQLPQPQQPDLEADEIAYADEAATSFNDAQADEAATSFNDAQADESFQLVQQPPSLVRLRAVAARRVQ